MANPLPTFAVWLPMLGWFAALRPGLMSTDSLAVWRQATEGGWVDHHPPAYTLAMWVSAKAVGSPSLLVLAQSLFLAAGIVALGRAVVRLGGPRRLVVVAAAAVAASPMVGGFAMSLWKDVPYTAALLFVTARVSDLTRTRLTGEGQERRAVRSLAGWLAAATALRQNGIIFAVVLLVLLALWWPAPRRTLALVAAGLILWIFALKVLIYPLAGVSRAPTQASLATFFHDIAAVTRSNPEVFEPDDRELLGHIAPLSLWQEESAKFSCSSANWQWSSRLDWSGLDGRAGAYLGLWFEALRERPGQVIENRLCVGAIAYRPDTVGSVYYVSTGIDANPYGLEPAPIWSALREPAVRLLQGSAYPSVQWLLWRGPVWIYLAWLALGISAWRLRRPALLMLAAPGFALQASVFAVNPAQDARYMFAGVLLGSLLLPVVLARPGTEGSDGPSMESPTVVTENRVRSD